MSSLIDDISRIIASPVSRRRAFKMVGGAVGGAVLGSLGMRRAAFAQGRPEGPPFCPPGETRCDRTCCHRDQKCCTDHCCGTEQICCSGHACCPPESSCCGGHCCGSPRTKCCGDKCCPEGNFCCDEKCVKSRPSPSAPCFPT
jgi:hypothetical protein